MQQISSQTGEYSPTEKIKQFHTETTFLSTMTVMNKKFIANLVGKIWE